MRRISRLSLAAVLFCLTGAVGAQSLWSPGFTGYLTGKSSLAVGDLVSVIIDTNTKLTYESSDVSSRTITLAFNGGGNPLSFLPGGDSAAKASLKGGEEIKLSTRLVARVQRLENGGQAFVQGSRTLELNGRMEMVSVSGWLDPAMLTDGGKAIAFDDLADSKLVYTSTLVPGRPILTQADIASILAQAAPAPSIPAAPSPPVTVPSAPPPTGAAGAAAPTLQLTEAAKRRLLLDYLNKMLDLIFSSGTP